MNKGNNSFLKLQFNYKIINHIKKKTGYLHHKFRL